MKQRTKKKAALALLAVLCLAAGARLRLAALLPDTFSLSKGETLTIAAMPFLSAKQKSGEVPAASMESGSSYNVELELFGVLPVKTVRAEVSDRRTVLVSGEAFGIKMFSAGVMVVGFSDVLTDGGYSNPAKEAGLQLGDYVTEVDGVKIRTNSQMLTLMRDSNGKTMTVSYTRSGAAHTAELTPKKDSLSGSWRTGMWVRDSSAGIGTLTFIDEQRGIFAGLGHSVTDVDTGESLTLSTGEIVPVNISGAVPGVTGVPGELKGSFISGAVSTGSIRLNGSTGVYGLSYGSLSGVRTEVASMQEVVCGPAQILTTIDGKGVKAYDVKIEKLAYNADDPNKNMLIRVTDEELLGATGGIVQGMSGSPILQNGRLVGAVTHVLVKDPTRGFGIFVGNMLETADSIAEVSQKAAS